MQTINKEPGLQSVSRPSPAARPWFRSASSPTQDLNKQSGEAHEDEFKEQRKYSLVNFSGQP